jgi:peptidoglycan-N-acetylglucosamine deacetylase
MLAVGAADVLVGCATGTATSTTRATMAVASAHRRLATSPASTHTGRAMRIRATAEPLPPIPPARPGPPAIYFGAPGRTRQIALTIDDGYSAATVAGYVEFAQRSGIPLTFSPNGVYQEIWNRHAPALHPLIEAGQVQIGNHTWTHRNMVDLSDAAVQADIERNEDWIQRTFGVTSRPWFRPPYGARNRRTDAVAGDIGFTHILMWNGSFGDSLLLTPTVLLAQARRYLTPGTIMLGHANHATILRLFSQVEQLIAQRRLQPVTLDGMFHTSRATG